jgi:tRNA threonylcarbamoyladenosine biosynthesis protein TsaB
VSADAAVTVLGIDTSGILGGVALARGGRLLAEIRCDAREAASERILPQIARLLGDLGLERGEIGRVGVALGPGSFTGLRVGLTTARGLCQGLGIPLVGVSSLEARIRALDAPGRAVLAATAYRRGQLFCAAGWQGDDGFQVLLPEASRALEEAGEWMAPCLASARGAGVTPILCTGDAAEALLAQLCRGALAGDAPDLIPVIGAAGAVPGSVALLAAAAEADQLMTGSDVDALMPRYLRGSYARRPGAPRGERMPPACEETETEHPWQQ